jgi:predicted  nucleic acid-binding Zn-ribbon protein
MKYRSAREKINDIPNRFIEKQNEMNNGDPLKAQVDKAFSDKAKMQQTAAEGMKAGKQSSEQFKQSLQKISDNADALDRDLDRYNDRQNDLSKYETKAGRDAANARFYKK